MAIDIKFTCSHVVKDYIRVSPEDEESISISIHSEYANEEFSVILDKTTAIKLAKTIRTEIAKIK